MSKNTVTIGKLVEFSGAQHIWLGKDQKQPQNPNNAKTMLAECIGKVMADMDKYLKDWNELGFQYNKDIADIQINHAENIKEIEHAGMPGQATIEYSYNAKGFQARKSAMNILWGKLQSDRRELEAKEIEIEAYYSKHVPTLDMLPAQFVTAFRGIVIDPQYVDPNFLLKA